MKKKVLVISQHFPPEIGAASQRMNYMAQFLHDLGYDVTVLTSEPCYPKRDLYSDYYQGDKKEYPFSLKRVKPLSKGYSKGKFARVYHYLTFMVKSLFTVARDKNKYSYVIATSPPIFIGLLGVLAKMRFRCELYLDIRDLWPESVEGLKVLKKNNVFLRLGYYLETFIYNRSDCIIINSQSFASKVKDKLKTTKDMLYIPNGVSKSQLEKAVKKNKDNSVLQVTYTGNMGMAQGLTTIIEAAKLLETSPNIHFNLVGTGVCEKEVKDLAVKYKLENLTFFGAKSRAETMEILSNSHIAIIHLIDAKIFETVIPSKVFDYMLSSLPIVAGINGEGAKIIRDSGCGILFEPENPLALAQAIGSLEKDGVFRQNMGGKGFDYLKDNFMWDNNILTLHSKFSLKEEKQR